MGKPKKNVMWEKFVLERACYKQGEDENGGGGSIDEFDHVDISEGVDGMHDEDIFEAEEVMDESNIYDSWHSLRIIRADEKNT